MRIFVTAALLLCSGCLLSLAHAQELITGETRIIVHSGDWSLVGDLLTPNSDGPYPGVLLLHGAAGERDVYRELASHLAGKGIASLRLDLRGHGESTNRGHFVPGERQHDPLIWNAEMDVIAAHSYLADRAEFDSNRIAIVGASYSGEEMAEAGREFRYANAYVILSPGSFSDESIRNIDSSSVPWLFIVSNHDRFLQEITASVFEQSDSVEVVIVPGTSHATNILETSPGMAERIAVWLCQRLQLADAVEN